MDKLLPALKTKTRVQHHPALAHDKLGEFIAELRKQGGIAARALEFTILTATRTNEAIGARWNEIDFKSAAWVIPSARMKAGNEHRVPLSAAALTLLRTMRA